MLTPTPLQGLGELVLYLDYDGVLHHENVHWSRTKGAHLRAPDGYTLFQYTHLLEALLAPYPDLKIVLSTSWVRHYGCTNTAKRLPQSLRARVIGATYHSRMNPSDFNQAPRGMQVWSDVLRRQPRDWIALDDDYLHWPAWCRDKFIQSDEHEGISAPAVHMDLQRKLAVMCAQDMTPPPSMRLNR